MWPSRTLEPTSCTVRGENPEESGQRFPSKAVLGLRTHPPRAFSPELCCGLERAGPVCWAVYMCVWGHQNHKP